MGQLCKPILDTDAASLQFELNQTTLQEQGYYWRLMFPLKQVPRFSVKTIEGDEDLPVAARRVAFNTKNPLFTRKEIGKKELELGKYAASRDMDEKQVQEYRDLLAIAAASTDPSVATELVNMTYDDVRFCKASMPAKIEMDALGIASLGKQVFPVSTEGDMATEDEIDFNVPEANFGGVSVVWSDEKNADGLQDLINMQSKIGQAGYGKPKFAWMEDKAFKQLIAQEKTAKRLFPASKILDVFSTGMLTLDVINGWMDKMGYPHILVIDSWVGFEDKNGKRTNMKPWNENVIALSETPQLGWTYWKRKHIEQVEEMISFEQEGEFYNVTIEGERNPDKVTTSAEAYAQVGLTKRRTKGFINVANTTWNGGKSA